MISNKITTGVRDPINNRVRFGNRTQQCRSLDYSNLPTKITCTNPVGGGSRFIYFVYDASGQKHQKIVKDINCGFGGCTYPAPVTYTYVNGIEYKNDVLQRIAHTEGSVALQADGTTYAHEYVIKDHLGNTRVTYRDDDKPGSPLGTIKVDEIVQINHQYPFGLNMEGNWNGSFPEAKNKYQFGGKELNSDFGLEWNDFGARFYDPSVSRWLSVDPMSEKMRRHSPYNYAFDNPTRMIDPDGNAPQDVIISYQDKEGKFTNVEYKGGKLYNRVDGKTTADEYSGGNAYILSVKSDIDDAKSSDAKVKNVIEYLESKEAGHHTIGNYGGDGVTQTSHNVVRKDPVTKKVIGSHTRFVPEIDKANGLPWHRTATMGHELKHGYNAKILESDQRMLPGTTNPNIKYEEADAVNFQNLIHKYLGIPARTKYGNYDLELNKFLRTAEEYKIKPSENNYPQ